MILRSTFFLRQASQKPLPQKKKHTAHKPDLGRKLHPKTFKHQFPGPQVNSKYMVPPGK